MELVEGKGGEAGGRHYNGTRIAGLPGLRMRSGGCGGRSSCGRSNSKDVPRSGYVRRTGG